LWSLILIESFAPATRVGPGTTAGPAVEVLKPQTGSPPAGAPAIWMVPGSAQMSHDGEQGVDASDADGTVAGARDRLANLDTTGGLTPGLGASTGLGLGAGDGVVAAFVGGAGVGVGVGLGPAA
jgi:hypothetical protein